jgi:hypothetical protein
VARVTGQRASSTLPGCDTPRDAGTFPAHGDPADSAQSARSAWRSVTPSIAGTPHVRVSRDGGRTYPARRAGPLPAGPPAHAPCTVPVYDPGTAGGRVLVLDLDTSRGDVDGQAAGLGQLLEHHGALYIADISPSGGRHLYVRFSSPQQWRDLRDLARAIALRFPAVDPAPMCSLGGQISPPGSRAKRGGWRLLTMPLSEARAAVECPNGPEVWAALLDEFAGELQQGREQMTLLPTSQVEERQKATAFRPAAELDDVGVPWVPRLGGRAPVSAEMDRTARTGKWNRSRHAGRSEARMAILASAAARGWRFADVESAVASGTWKGLRELYHRASEPGRMERLLPHEWRKAVGFTSGEKNVRHWHTSDITPRPPGDSDGPSAEYGHTRRWVTACDVALEDPQRVRGWGGRVIAVRLVLLALAQAAMVSGSSTIEFGTRNLALYSCLSHRTVARVLRMLAAEDDPLIDLVSLRRMARADRYQLRIPGRYAESVRWRRRRAGRIDAIHPVFLILGGTAGLVYQVLDGTGARGAEVARAARLSPSAASAALRVLAGHGLAERGRGGWRRGAASLDNVATSTGAADLHRERAGRYRRDREGWRARLAQYQAARHRPAGERDGWLSLDDPDEYDFMACRWPVLTDDLVRGPPAPARAQESA